VQDFCFLGWWLSFVIMSLVYDQLHQSVNIPARAQRIVSLVPSQTELLYDLGLDREVVGITKFCIHPVDWRKRKTIIGGTKQFDIEAIHKLQPDLIIGNKEENYQEGIEILMRDYPVWMSDIYKLDDALTMIEQIGMLTHKQERAGQLVQEIQQQFSTIKTCNGQRVLYLIWRKPWMAAGQNTFINNMLAISGFINCLDEERYPELTTTTIESLNPDFIFLSSEPYPFKEKHIAELQQILPNAKLVLVDGEMFSWYGSRLLKFPAYLHSLIQHLNA
jgi:ABC-type Fe3+-hydroxamate transport system substrate-binding protein